MNYLDSLNEKQKEAVLYTNGPLLIVAGAGAGKTKTITHRIVHLIHEGLSPKSILAVTFTNKAAKEMRDRVFEMLKDKQHGVSGEIDFHAPFVSTFHALGVHIIKENSHLIGLNKYFSIYDENDSISLIKRVMKNRDIDTKQHDPKKIKSIISKSKGDFITVDDYNNNVNSALGSIVAVVWLDYERELKKEKALDFDDLLLEAVLLLKKFPEIKNNYHKKWKHVHIDEYQDTNEVQYEMAKLLVGPEQNICVVGDTDQNIYSWRGANIKNMLLFEKDYPNSKIILLEQNYRSTKKIIEAANCVIEKNQYRVPKNLFTLNKEGEEIEIYEAYDETDEALYVAETIDELLKNNKEEDFAILYRANFQSRVLEEAMLKKQIPYQVLGVKFFDRKEIKDVLSYIRASLNRDSLSDIKRIINIPARGVGKVTIVKIFSGMFGTLPEKMQVKLNEFYSLLDDIKEKAGEIIPSELIKYVIKHSGIEEELSHGSQDDLERLENMKELVTLAIKYDNFSEREGIEKLLEDASLSTDQDTLMHNNRGVRLMTVHASKGLEFKHVFITGLEQDLFPHAEMNANARRDSNKEEERRLFYVALTRARQKLFLSYSNIRTIYGMKQLNSPSEFIYDIPSKLTSFKQGRSRSGEKIIYI